MSDELKAWMEESGTQGLPYRYNKTDVEMGAMRLFDRFKFNAGKSQRERRRSFNEVWDASNGNCEAIAYGFDAALKGQVFSIHYVIACIKNFLAGAVVETGDKDHPLKVIGPRLNMPKIKPAPVKPPVRRKKKAPEPQGPVEKFEWS